MLFAYLSLQTLFAGTTDQTTFQRSFKDIDFNKSIKQVSQYHNTILFTTDEDELYFYGRMISSVYIKDIQEDRPQFIAKDVFGAVVGTYSPGGMQITILYNNGTIQRNNEAQNISIDVQSEKLQQIINIYEQGVLVVTNLSFYCIGSCMGVNNIDGLNKLNVTINSTQIQHQDIKFIHSHSSIVYIQLQNGTVFAYSILVKGYTFCIDSNDSYINNWVEVKVLFNCSIFGSSKFSLVFVDENQQLKYCGRRFNDLNTSFQVKTLQFDQQVAQLSVGLTGFIILTPQNRIFKYGRQSQYCYLGDEFLQYQEFQPIQQKNYDNDQVQILPGATLLFKKASEQNH